MSGSLGVMARYRSVWKAGCGCASLLGIGLALMEWSLSSVLLLFGFAAVTCALVHYCLAFDCSAGRSTRGSVAQALLMSVWVGVVTLATTAVAVALPLLAVTLVVVAGVSSPRCMWYLRAKVAGVERIQEQRLRGDVEARAVGSVPDVAALADAELCRAWVATFDTLQPAPDWMTLERVALLRQSYLDELERRDPEALVAWLHSGARASSNPGRYLGGQE